MIDRLIAIANDTLKIAKEGIYTNKNTFVVHLGSAVDQCVTGTELIYPAQWGGILALADLMEEKGSNPLLSVTNETTLQSIQRLAKGGKVVALNFASARNPGGGFLKGTVAQEESIARASALYASLTSQPKFYEINRACGHTAYTDHAIYSPNVPVFKDDDGEPLDEPYLASFITMPAPNRSKGSTTAAKANEVIIRRIHYILALAVAKGYDTIVLGAWGCGVFRNDPDAVAKAFSVALRRWKKYFRRISFAICGGGRTRKCFESGLLEHL